MKRKIINHILKEIDEDTYIPPSYFPQGKESISTPNVLDDRIKILSELEEEVNRCKLCSLGLYRIKAVFGMGNPYSRIMFVGEGPGWDEDHKGLPFVGRAGQLLDKILQAINLDRTKVYIANIVKCHPMKNPSNPELRGNDRPPNPDEISACRTYIEKQINIIKPACIVCLGNTATKFFLPYASGVSSVRGRFYTVEGKLFGCEDSDLVVLPTYHPAALLRNPALKKDMWHDMKMLRDFINQNFK